MSAKSWVCKCGHENNPDDPGFSSSKCNGCSKNRYVMFYIAGAGLFGAFIIVLAISFILGMPQKKYMAQYKKANADGTITAEEQAVLDETAKRYKISPDQIKDWTAAAVSEGPTPKPPVIANITTTTAPPDGPKEEGVSVEAKLNLSQGMNYIKIRDYDNAINEFTVAIQKSPDYAVAYSNRGIAYMQQKKYNKASDDLQKAAQIAPNDPMVYYNLASLYSVQKQLDRAIDSIDKALELGFNDYDALRNDPDLKNLSAYPDYRKVLEKHKVFIK